MIFLSKLISDIPMADDHYNPQVYLKSWTLPPTRQFVKKKHYKHYKQKGIPHTKLITKDNQAISGICSQDRGDIVGTNVILTEKLLTFRKLIENAWPNVIAELLQGKIVTPHAKNIITKLVVAMMLYTPVGRLRMIKALHRTPTKLIKDFVNFEFKKDDDEIQKKLFETPAPIVSIKHKKKYSDIRFPVFFPSTRKNRRVEVLKIKKHFREKSFDDLAARICFAAGLDNARTFDILEKHSRWIFHISHAPNTFFMTGDQAVVWLKDQHIFYPLHPTICVEIHPGSGVSIIPTTIAFSDKVNDMIKAANKNAFWIEM